MASKPIKALPAIAKPSAQDKLSAFGIDRVCEMTADTIAARVIAVEIGVSWATLTAWIDADQARSEQYAHARAAQADKFADDILSIADELTIEASYKGEDVTLDVSSSAVARNRLRVDARKWLASKMAPKKYGDKLALGGADDLAAIKQVIDVTLSPTDAYLRMIGK